MPGPSNDLNINEPGYVVFDGTATFLGRTFQAGTGISITNADGIAGDSTISVTSFPRVLTTTYTSSNTWTPDPNLLYAKIYIWNGGSGGGSGRSGNTVDASGGGGGAGGTFTVMEVLASNLLSPSYSITIGSGGNGGAGVISSNGNAGSTGGTSSVGNLLGNVYTSIGSGRISGGGGGTPLAIPGGAAGGNTCIQMYILSQLGASGTTQQGEGGAGVFTTPSDVKSYNYAVTCGGGGGGGYTANVARSGLGGNTVLNGDGVTPLFSGGTGSTGAGGNGNSPPSFELIIGGSGGGGGGNNGVAVTPTAGSGGNGGAPAGGGGGGGANATGIISGAGGNGARGQIMIVEFLSK